MADKENKKKVGLETIALGLILIVVMGGFYMTWKVVDESAKEVEESIEVRTSALQIAIDQLSESNRRRAKTSAAAAAAAAPKPDPKPADDKDKPANDEKK